MADIHEDREQFARDNIGLIYDFMDKFHIKYREDEIIDILYIGYTNALNTYSKELGEFSTYAFSCMQNAWHQQDCLYNSRAMRSKDIAVVSLNTLVGEEKDSELIDFIGDPNIDIENEVLNKILVEHVYKSKGLLTFYEQYLFECYFEKGFTLERIGKSLGISKERVRQRIDRMINKLKKYYRKANFITSLDTISTIDLAKEIFKGSGIV